MYLKENYVIKIIHEKSSKITSNDSISLNFKFYHRKNGYVNAFKNLNGLASKLYANF